MPFYPFQHWLCFFKTRHTTYHIRNTKHEIGFVWFCFLLPKTAQNHKNLRLCSFKFIFRNTHHAAHNTNKLVLFFKLPCRRNSGFTIFYLRFTIFPPNYDILYTKFHFVMYYTKINLKIQAYFKKFSITRRSLFSHRDLREEIK